MRDERQKEYERTYYARHRKEIIVRKVEYARQHGDQTRKRNARWAAANPEKMRAKDRAYYLSHRKIITERIRLKNKEHYDKKDEIYYRRIERQRKRYRDRKEFIESYKSIHPCTCGEKDISCLVFHHRDLSKKEYNIGNMMGMPWDRIKDELSKCDIICANCHMKLHARLRTQCTT